MREIGRHLGDWIQRDTMNGVREKEELGMMPRFLDCSDWLHVHEIGAQREIM